MKLDWIKAVACDICGETEVVEERASFYNFLDMGKQAEYRTFKCGREVMNERNCRDEFRCTCTKSADYKKFEKKLHDIKESMKSLLIEKGIVEEQACSIVASLTYHVYPSSFEKRG